MALTKNYSKTPQKNLILNPFFEKPMDTKTIVTSNDYWLLNFSRYGQIVENIYPKHRCAYFHITGIPTTGDPSVDFPKFNIKQNVIVDNNKKYSISIKVLTPDKTTLLNESIFINIDFKNVDSLLENKIVYFNINNNNQFETKTLIIDTSTVPNTTNIDISFGTDKNGTFYIANPTLNEINQNQNNIIIMPLDNLSLGIYDNVNGTLLGIIKYSQLQEVYTNL
jgi:hypothetical protein